MKGKKLIGVPFSVAAVPCAFFLIGVSCTLTCTRIFHQDPIDSIVAVSWGDGKYGEAFYGAEVYLEKQEKDYSVKARIHVGRGNSMYHDCGEIGRASTPEEAVSKFGEIKWSPEGLTIGSDESSYFLARKRLESHR